MRHLTEEIYVFRDLQLAASAFSSDSSSPWPMMTSRALAGSRGQGLGKATNQGGLILVRVQASDVTHDESIWRQRQRGPPECPA
jgi:hypothetical protein